MITTAEEFYRLRTSKNKEDYDRATYEDLPLNVWLEIVGKYPEMRSWVAHNKTVPIEILEILVRDSDVSVRCSVAVKRKLPEHLQLLLAQDDDDSVRERLVWNPKATKKVLQFLSNDKEHHIGEKARRKLNVKK